MIYTNHKLDLKNLTKLKKFKKNKRIPHAFLFHGSEGVGKEFAAIEFAALINCESPVEDLSCRTCHSCLKLLSNNHDLVNYVFPLPKGKKVNNNDGIEKSMSENVATEFRINLDKKIKNPYHEIKLKNANTILIDSIRSIKKTIFRTTENNSYRIVLIFEAEKLCFPNNEAANSLLKLLEEPPKKSIFILVTSKADLLIDTVKSRCLDIYFPKPSPEIFNFYCETLSNESINLYRFFDGNIKLLKKIEKNSLSDIEKFYLRFKKFILSESDKIDLEMLYYLIDIFKSKSNLSQLIILAMKCFFKDAISSIYIAEYEPIFSFFDKQIAKKINSLESNFLDKIIEFEKDYILNVNLELAIINLLQGLKK